MCDLDVMLFGFFVSILPNHIYPFGGVSFNKVKFCETCPRIWQFSISVDIPIVINSFFLWNVQVGMSWPDDINVFQWIGEWFFFWHVLLNSRFDMMTVNQVSWNRPEVFLSFRVIFLFLQVETLPCRLENLRWDSLSSRCVPSQSGFLEFVVSPLIMLLNRLPQEIQILRLRELSGLILHSVFWDRFLMRPTFLIHQYQQRECLLSKFLPRSKHILERVLVTLSLRSDEF